jgi:predicted secreted protein
LEGKPAIAAVALLWLPLASLCGWRSAQGREVPAPTLLPAGHETMVEVRAADAGREIRLASGQLLSVDLPAASASGYSCWVSDPAGHVLEIEREPARAILSRTWIFRAAESGRDELRFDCHQELSGEPIRRYAFQILVE